MTTQPQSRELSLVPGEGPSSQISFSEITTTVPVDERVGDRVQTVYLRAVPAGPESHGPRLVLVFLSTFATTLVVVMGAWTLLGQRLEPLPPRVEVVHVEKPVPVPVPVPVPAAPPAMLSLDRPPEPAQPLPKVAPRPRPVPAPVPAPVVAVDPAPAPVPAVSPEAPLAPPAARALTGTYTGKGDGRAMVMSVRFLPDGLLAATIRRGAGGQEVVAEARGTYELREGFARVVLMEQGVPEPVAYTGTVSAEGADGRMTQSGRNLGKFSVQR